MLMKEGSAAHLRQRVYYIPISDVHVLSHKRNEIASSAAYRVSKITIQILSIYLCNHFIPSIVYQDASPSREVRSTSARLGVGSDRAVLDNHLLPIDAPHLDVNPRSPESRRILEEIVVLALKASFPSSSSISADLEIADPLVGVHSLSTEPMR